MILEVQGESKALQGARAEIEPVAINVRDLLKEELLTLHAERSLREASSTIQEERVIPREQVLTT